MPTEISFSVGAGLSRIRIPKALVAELGWSAGVAVFDLVGILTFPGELLCSARSAIDGDPSHPFHEALNLRSSSALHEGWTRIAGPGGQFALAFRVFDFEARWTTDAHAQLDLAVGAAVVKLCGWPDSEGNPPLYAAVRGNVLALLSSERMTGLLEQPVAR